MAQLLATIQRWGEPPPRCDACGEQPGASKLEGFGWLCEFCEEVEPELLFEIAIEETREACHRINKWLSVTEKRS